jgi:hypothetical protein
MFLLLVVSQYSLFARGETAADPLNRLLARAGHDTARCVLLLSMIEEEPDDRIWIE